DDPIPENLAPEIAHIVRAHMAVGADFRQLRCGGFGRKHGRKPPSSHHREGGSWPRSGKYRGKRAVSTLTAGAVVKAFLTRPRARASVRFLVDDAFLHHEVDVFEFANVGERVAGDRDEIAIF